MNKQMSLSGLMDELCHARTKKKEFLEQMERLIPWGEWVEEIRPCYYKGERGNKPYELELMLRLYVLQNLYTEWNQWVRSEKEQLAAVMERHGIEWEDKGTHDKHLSVLDYKKEQRAKEIAELEAVKAKKQGQVEQQEQRLKELAPAVKNMEQLAAQSPDDPEQILSEPGPLESAKSYREKKAKPLLAKIVKVLRSLYRAYIELKGKYERLQGDYGRVREGNANLSERLQKVKMENKALRGTVADYERVKRSFGPEKIERAVEDANRREQAEREQRKAKRKFSRGAR